MIPAEYPNLLSENSLVDDPLWIGNHLSRLARFYIHENDISIMYDQAWIRNHISCQPTDLTYQWGFSFLLTFMFCVLTTAWSFGMYVMWADVHENSRVDRSGRNFGGMFWSVMDLATAIRGDLGGAADRCSNSELEKRLKQSKGGMSISSDELPLSRRGERSKRSTMEKEIGLLLWRIAGSGRPRGQPTTRASKESTCRRTHPSPPESDGEQTPRVLRLNGPPSEQESAV